MLRAGIFILLLAATGIPQSALSADAMLLPAAERSFASPGGHFLLKVRLFDGRRANAELLDLQGDKPRSLWQLTLLQEQGPRFAVVTDRGTVLLVDEWINVISRHALQLIDRSGRTIAHYPAEHLFKLLAVPRFQITVQAKAGPWISRGPTLSPDQTVAEFQAGGRRLRVDLATGDLRVGD